MRSRADRREYSAEHGSETDRGERRPPERTAQLRLIFVRRTPAERLSSEELLTETHRDLGKTALVYDDVGHYEALAAAAKLSDRYITDRFLPDKAVDLIDEASSRVRLQATLPPAEIREVDAQLRRVIAEKESVVKNQEFEKASSVRDREEKLRLEKARLEQEWQEKKAAQADKPLMVTGDSIAEIVSSWTRIPVSRLAQAETEKLLNMGAQLHQRVVGQDQAIEVITRAIRRSRAGLSD